MLLLLLRFLVLAAIVLLIVYMLWRELGIGEWLRSRFPESASEPEAPDPPSLSADETEWGEWLHGILMDACGAEREEWAVARVQRVTERLQAPRAPADRLQTEILWLPDATAFTGPGRYVYISRRLLERCTSDDPAAFVLAHEIAHHDLGHVELFRGWLSSLPRTGAAVALAAAVRLGAHRLYGPEREAEADARALDLCLEAGYDPARCLELFDILEAHSLDLRDLDGVFGPDFALETKLDGRTEEWLRQVRLWAWERARGYPPLRTRKELLLARLELLEGTGPGEPAA